MTEYNIRITHAENGWALQLPTEWDDGTPRVVVTVFTAAGDDDERAAWAALLRTLTDAIGPTYNKWGRREVHIDCRPGHKLEAREDVDWFLREVMHVDAPTDAQVAAVLAAVGEEPDAVETQTAPWGRPQAGETWLTRDGRTAYVMRDDLNGHFPLRVGVDGLIFSHTQDGRFYQDGPEEGLDLVTRVPDADGGAAP